MSICIVAVSGCASDPLRRAEIAPPPETWATDIWDGETGSDPAALINWWRGFEDPVLDSLVAEALERSPTARIAASRVREARALSGQTLAAYLPQLSGVGTISYTRVEDGLPLSGAGGFENEQAIGSLGPQVRWELPLFGRIEASVSGARANTAVARADERGVRAALAADIAQTYVDLRSIQQRLAALQEAVAISEKLAGILDIAANAGFAAPADAADARRLTESQRATIPDLEIALFQARARLAVLRGRAPGQDGDPAEEALRAPSPTPRLAIAQAPSTPAEVLAQRPDVAQARGAAALAAANVGVARADLLPQLQLQGSVNFTSDVTGGALGEAGVRVTGAPVLSIPLFGWGQRLNALRARDARLDQAIASYENTVNQAAAEAGNALVGLTQSRRRSAAARAAETAAEVTARGIRASFDAGIASLSDRLRADQQLIDARSVRIEAERAEALAAIQIYRAFGGGPGA